jgi:type IV pilus assembly protein PilE
MKHAKGFTLIELLIAVAIMGILAAIAIPAYSDYTKRGKIPEALSGLAAKRIAMEQFYQDNRTYVNGTGCTTDSSTSKYFDFSCATAATATAYTIRAVGKSSMTGFTYTIDQSNTKTTTAVPSGWSLPNPNTCWATKRDGTC